LLRGAAWASHPASYTARDPLTLVSCAYQNRGTLPRCLFQRPSISKLRFWTA